MTFRIEPFSSGFSNALLQAGQVPNMAEAYAAGEKQRAARDRLLAQQKASQMMAQGDEEGATSLLLSVADPGEGLRYQIARQNAAAEQSRQQFTDEQHAREYADTQREQAAAAARAEESLKLQRDAARRAAQKEAPFGTTIPGDQGAPPAADLTQRPAGPRDPYYQPVAPQAPPAPIISPQTGNLDTGVGDVPLNPGQGAFGQGAPVTPAQGIAAAVQPPAAPQQQPQAQAPQQQAAPSAIAQQLAPGDPEKQRRIDATIAARGTNEDVMKIVTESPRQATLNPVFQMEDKFRNDYLGLDVTKKFQARSAAYGDILANARDADTHPGETIAADTAMVFNFMHFLDPSSIVSPGEQANVKNAGGVPEQVRTMYNNLLNGQTMDPKVRGQIVRYAKAIYAKSYGQQQRIESQWRGIAGRNEGVDPYAAVPDVTMGILPADPTEYEGASLPGQQGGYQPGQGGASIWAEFTKRLQQRLNRGAGPQQ